MTISMQLNEQFCLILSLKFTGKPWKSKKSFLSGHKWEGVNTKVTQNFRSLVINYMTAHDHYYAIKWTILFNTILGQACDVRSSTGRLISLRKSFHREESPHYFWNWNEWAQLKNLAKEQFRNKCFSLLWERETNLSKMNSIELEFKNEFYRIRIHLYMGTPLTLYWRIL
jgi:hypothetical protein